MRVKRAISGAFLLLCSVGLISGCDDSFQPLQENDKYYFSIYGTLDAAADTQWVRVGIPRQSVQETPDPDRITVVLEDIKNGESVVMQDSLFTSKKLLNYWTTMPIENERTYRIKAVRNDGKSGQVTVTIPKELPTPIVWKNDVPPGYIVYIDDSVEHIADVQTRWYVLLNPETEKLKKTYNFSYRNKIEPTGVFGGAYQVFVRTSEERQDISESSANADIEVLHAQIFVAAGGPEWDDNISSINDLEYFLDGTASNVENGLGYVVGIDSKWVPFKTCLTADSSNVIPCEPEEPFW